MDLSDRSSHVTDILRHIRRSLSDHYEIEGRLDDGGMASVFLAKDLDEHRTVAIKVLRSKMLDDADGWQGLSSDGDTRAQRFLREIGVMEALVHSRILPLLDAGEAGGLPYLVTPYIEGGSLLDMLERDGPFDIRDAVQIGIDVADALHFAHEVGVLHRDIKPANILLSEGHALIADFGLARVLSDSVQKLTRTGVVVGTIGYMSPEQATAGDLDGRTDVYSLGCVLYEMLTGERALGGPTRDAITSSVLTTEPGDVRDIRADLPGPLGSVVMKALAKSRSVRYPSAAALAHALAESVAG